MTEIGGGESRRAERFVAALSFGFVFIHPFEDGNGCIHHFLIHHVLARSGFTPKGLLFPYLCGDAAEHG
ncbi:MAG: Fic family protein [Pyrinomonadaceae bacterium]